MAQRKIKLSGTNRSILTRFPMHSAYVMMLPINIYFGIEIPLYYIYGSKIYCMLSFSYY